MYCLYHNSMVILSYFPQKTSSRTMNEFTHLWVSSHTCTLSCVKERVMLLNQLITKYSQQISTENIKVSIRLKYQVSLFTTPS